jgi:hypothetical protein
LDSSKINQINTTKNAPMMAEKLYSQSQQAIDTFKEFTHLEPNFGWFSLKQAAISSRMYYSPLKGHAVYVSLISADPTISSTWDDIVPIGVVTYLIPSDEEKKGKYPTYYQNAQAISDFNQYTDAYYAWYSRDKTQRSRSYVYYSPCHKCSISVTHVTKQPIFECGYFDIVPLGVVTKFIGHQ